MKASDFKIVIWKEGDHYISQCLDVDVSSFGKTKKEALKMIEDALNLYFEGRPLPKKSSRIKNPLIDSVTLQHA